jgi:hypothetical protein
VLSFCHVSWSNAEDSFLSAGPVLGLGLAGAFFSKDKTSVMCHGHTPRPLYFISAWLACAFFWPYMCASFLHAMVRVRVRARVRVRVRVSPYFCFVAFPSRPYPFPRASFPPPVKVCDTMVCCIGSIPMPPP